jgi:hypothetical protein
MDKIIGTVLGKSRKDKKEVSMNNDYIIDEIGEKINYENEEKLILISEKGADKDIVNSVLLNRAGEEEAITRYGSNKAEDDEK